MYPISGIQPARTSRRPFILFLLGALLFIAIVTMALFYGISRPQTAAIETQERGAVEQCWRSSRSLSPSSASRRFQEDACREMQAQFRGKFGHGQ
jgi:hypothetical protein